MGKQLSFERTTGKCQQYKQTKGMNKDTRESEHVIDRNSNEQMGNKKGLQTTVSNSAA